MSSISRARPWAPGRWEIAVPHRGRARLEAVRRWVRLGLAALVALSLVALSLGCSDTKAPARLPAPDFDLEKVGGGRLTLEDLRGKLVLLDFWATWCVPCIKAIPELNALYAARREQGVEVVGIAVDDLEAEELATWLEEKGVEYPVARADAALAEAYGAFQFPQHVLLSPQGEILEQMQPGVHTRDELDALIDRHLD